MFLISSFIIRLKGIVYGMLWWAQEFWVAESQLQFTLEYLKHIEYSDGIQWNGKQ